MAVVKKILNWKVVVGVLALLAIAVSLVVLVLVCTGPKRHGTPVPAVVMDMHLLRFVLQEYRKEHGRYPEGDSRAIIRAIRGYFDVSSRKLLPDDSFLDPWETPFVIRIVPDKEIELRSAGPDRKFGTLDDVVTISQIEP